MTKINTFRSLHTQNTPLLLANAWNVQSALLYQKMGFKAMGTSSAAIATSLGYEDGEQMPFSDLLRIVKGIQSKINVPFTVDIEGGYTRDTDKIVDNISELSKLGVVGVNIEDSITTNTREIVDATLFASMIQDVKKKLVAKEIDIFMNVRTDAYIMGLDDPFEKTMERIKIFRDCGADGIFVPCVTKEQEITAIVKSTTLPINVMCMPNLSDFAQLKKLGVKRISMGPFPYVNMVSKLEKSIEDVLVSKSFKPLFID